MAAPQVEQAVAQVEQAVAPQVEQAVAEQQQLQPQLIAGEAVFEVAWAAASQVGASAVASQVKAA